MLKLGSRRSEKNNKVKIINKIKTPKQTDNTVGNFIFGSKKHYVKKEICFYRRGPRST